MNRAVLPTQIELMEVNCEEGMGFKDPPPSNF